MGTLDAVARGRRWWRLLLTEPGRPAWVRARPGAHWLVVGTVCVGAFMGQLDVSIVTVAFPTLQGDLDEPLGAIEWVALSYLLVLVSSVVAVGRLSDVHGRKLCYTYGFVVFSAASLGCALASDLTVLVLFRVVQALGAAMLQANSVALIATSLPPQVLGRGIGIQGAAQALGLALGPSVGGLLVALGGWRLIFLVNVPVGIIGVVAAWLLLPRSTQLSARTRFDWFGLGLFATAATMVLLAFSRAPSTGFAAPATGVLLGGGLAVLAAFLAAQRRSSAPLVELGLFRRVSFSAGIASGFLSYAVLFGVLFVMPFLFERALGMPPARSGLVLTVLPVALAVTSPVAGRLADRFGARTPTVTGMLLVALALALVGPVVTRPTGLVVLLAVTGVGMGLFTAPNNAAIMAGAPSRLAGAAGGLLNMTRGIGTAMGVSLAGVGLGVAAAGPVGGADAVRGAVVLSCGVFAVMAVLAAIVAGLRDRGASGLSGDHPVGPRAAGRS